MGETLRENRRDRENSKKRREINKQKIFNYYGGTPPVCACCGEKEIAFLSLDHINGGGIKHRKSIGSTSGAAMYSWAIRNDFPPMFQVLCMNCNFAKGSNGKCPHEKN